MKEYFQQERIQIGFPVASADKHKQTEHRHQDLILKYFSIFYKGHSSSSRKHVHS